MHPDDGKENREVEDTPWAVTAEDVFDLEAEKKTAEGSRSTGWPFTPKEMDAHLKRIIPLLQRGSYPFYDPALDDWYRWEPGVRYPSDREKLCREAYLHAELWANEETSEEMWALVALKEGWRPPDEEIEWAVWYRATGRKAILEAYDIPETREDDFRF